ncbi:hypothetical protein AB7714_12895 [Tardiphaga sp. 1201_B9_N1_1]|jgi:hypothetical protein|uniref:hypothetical protein n=1 Tax=unclassified Tardiphaga TaxID=2631404 RepID=UPI003F288702
MAELDYIEVGREAHELSHAHGRNAYLHADRQAQWALEASEADEHTFWQAVAAALKPR